MKVDESEFVLADIPGLIEGAAEGRGLGHEFLRHVERAMVLVVLLDPSPLQERTVEDQYDVLLAELEGHSPDLLHRPRVVAVTKADLVADPPLGNLADRVAGLHHISSATHDGIDGLMYAIASVVDRTARELPEREGYILHRPVPAPFELHRRGDDWELTGKAVSRAVNLADLTIPDAADLAAERLRRVGVYAALEAAGAIPGDTVRIGALEFEYLPDVPWEDDDDWFEDEEE